MGKLNGKVAIVTGGTSGIGEATVKLFSQEGAIVCIIGRNETAGAFISNELLGSTFYKCDVSVGSDIPIIVNKILTRHGKIDILFNNAGIFYGKDVGEQKIFETNVFGCKNLVDNCLSALQESHGVILNNASIAGIASYNVGQSYIYSASKAAIIKMTQMMAKNYSKNGIRVNCISPGIIDTPIFNGSNMSGYLDRIPMGRIGLVNDVAKAALFLCSDDSSYITGHNLVIDGGVSI